MEEIERKDVIAYMAALKSQGCGPRTVVNRVSFLKTLFLHQGLKWPLLKSDRPRYTEKVVSAYSQEEIRCLMTAADQEEYELFQFFLCVFEQLVHNLRQVLRLQVGRKVQPTSVILDSRTLQSTPESGTRTGYDGAKRRKDSKVHLAVDTLGHLLALHVTPADEQNRAQVGALAAQIQQVTGENVQLAYVDQGYTGEAPAQAAAQHGIQLEVVKLSEAKQGFVFGSHERTSSALLG